MKKSFKVCIQKIYVNKNVHALIFNKENLKIIGVYQSDKRMNFIKEGVSETQKERILRYLHENCMDTSDLRQRTISGSVMIRVINLCGIEKILLIKGISIIGIYQNNGVDFVEDLPNKIAKEALKELYQFGYITADIYAKIVNKFDSIQLI